LILGSEAQVQNDVPQPDAGGVVAVESGIELMPAQVASG
jgi:hypothetical protein